MDKIILLLKELKKASLLQKEILTIEELSLYTGYSVDYIYKLVHERNIPYTKPPLGRKLFFIKQEIVNWLTSNKYCSNNDLEAKADSFLMAKKFGR